MADGGGGERRWRKVAGDTEGGEGGEAIRDHAVYLAHRHLSQNKCEYTDELITVQVCAVSKRMLSTSL